MGQVEHGKVEADAHTGVWRQMQQVALEEPGGRSLHSGRMEVLESVLQLTRILETCENMAETSQVKALKCG